MTPRTFIFTVPAPCKFINSNNRLHHHAKAELTRAWRQSAAMEARRVFAGIELTIPVRIVAAINKPGNRRWDPNNLAPTTKACVDGIVDAGVIPDDSWREVVGPDHRRGTAAPDSITFTIEEMA